MDGNDGDNGIEKEKPMNPATIISRIHRLVVLIRSSPQREQNFKNMVAAGKPKIIASDLTVILDVSTRWNSTFHMLLRAKRLRVPIDMFINSDSSFQKYRLTSDEWAFLEHVLNILQPIDDVTNFLSKSKYPSISLVIPAYSGCLEQIQSVAVLSNDLMDLQLAIEKKNQ